jgi:ABC-type transporter Mla subunit MlaD
VLARGALLAGVIAVVVIVLASGSQSAHKLQVVVPEAIGVIPGERMVAGGQQVGSIDSASVTRDGKAHLVMAIDNSAWPLPRDTALTLRMGGTIKFSDRYIEIGRGHQPSMLRSGDYIPASQFVVPVEYDTVFNTFDAPTRAGLQSLFNNGGPTFTIAAPYLRRSLDVAPGALVQVDHVFRDLGYDTNALSTLVRSTDHLLGAVATANPGVRQLLTSAADTFTAVASQSNALKQTIGDVPNTFAAARTTLSHASRTLTQAADLTDRLAPGVTQLRQIATPLSSALRTVVAVAPDAISTLSTVRTAAPSLDALLGQARSPLMPTVQSIGTRAAKQVACVRPYTPELLGALSTWAGFWGNGDAKDTMLHGALGATPMTNENPVDSATLGKLLPGLQIDFPPVPGQIVRQPWYQPQCGITPDSLSLSHDPEAGTFDPLGGKLLPYLK